jgi:hypothetical protein
MGSHCTLQALDIPTSNTVFRPFLVAAEAQNMAFCLLVKAYKWKCAPSDNHDEFKTTRLPSSTVATSYVCVFHLLTLADSIAICTETKTSNHYRSSTPC